VLERSTDWRSLPASASLRVGAPVSTHDDDDDGDGLDVAMLNAAAVCGAADDDARVVSAACAAGPRSQPLHTVTSFSARAQHAHGVSAFAAPGSHHASESRRDRPKAARVPCYTSDVIDGDRQFIGHMKADGSIDRKAKRPADWEKIIPADE
jgi:hypothetical protein